MFVSILIFRKELHPPPRVFKNSSQKRTYNGLKPFHKPSVFVVLTRANHISVVSACCMSMGLQWVIYNGTPCLAV